MPETSWSTPFLSALRDGPPLRIALALDPDLSLTRAEASIVADIEGCEFARIVAVVVVDGRRSRPGFGERLWRAYRRSDRRRNPVPDDPDRRQASGSRIAALPRIPIAGASGAAAGSISGGHDDPGRLDVVVDLRRGDPDRRPDLATIANHGVLGLTRRFRLRDRLVEVALEHVVDDGRPRRVRTGFFSLDPLAVGPSIASAVYGSTHLVIQQLREFHAGDEARPAFTAPHRARPPDQPGPSIMELVRVLGPVAIAGTIRRARRRLTGRVTRPHWRLAIRVRPMDDLLQGGSMRGFRWLEAPPGHAWADPFLIEHEERTWLFFEDVSYATGRASIACAELSKDGGIGAATSVLESGGHLSYPYVFVDDGVVYLIPESRDAGVVRLYRATAFPSTWEVVADLYAGDAVDTSVIQDAGLWWFFTTLREPRGGAVALMLFTAQTLTGTWCPHPSNPVSLDVRTARGAGRIIRTGDRLVRPSQDGSHTYGYAFALNEIVTLTEDAYVERSLVSVTPSWSRGIDATHTYARLGSIEVTDGRTERVRAQTDGPPTGP
jgi:hypothetical protein